MPYSVDCEPSLASFLAELDDGFAFLRRTGNEQTGRWLDSYEWLVGVLRSQRAIAANEAVPLERYADDPTALFYAHLCRAIAAAIFGDSARLAEHSAGAMELLEVVNGFYPVAQVRLLRGLALAEEARATDGDARDDLLAELDELTRWLAGWASGAPDNFLHLLRLVEAERAWSAGHFRAAVIAFDAARREVAGRQRPWHRALIDERAARFFLAYGVEHVGYDLLARARDDYLAWGATAKVEQIDWAYPPVRPHADATTAGGGGERRDRTHHRSIVTTGTIDLLGILAASQALSSQTSIEQLHARVAEVLGAMTGATGVHLLLWSDERQDWLLPEAGGGALNPGTGAEHAVPMSVLRYLQRTREPLVVADATSDDRFARDVYFADVDACSLLAVPIVSRATLQALLVLENRLIRDAFTTDRLDVVKLIAGQLAVSLDNAQLYADYRRIADEQAALRRMATLVAEGRPPAAVFDAVTAEMAELLGASAVTLARYEGELLTVLADHGRVSFVRVGEQIPLGGTNVTSTVLRTGRAARLDDYGVATGTIGEHAREVGTRSVVAAPIVVDGRTWGVLAAVWADQAPPPHDTEERMARFAGLLETAVANADTRDQLTESRARVLAAGDDARRRVTRDLHDGAQQRLVNTIISLKLAKRALHKDPSKVETLLGDALSTAEQAITDLRELAHGILPSVLASGGLRDAVDAVASRMDLPVEAEIADERLPPDIEANAYFILAESLTNVVKHAHATYATVHAAVDDGVLALEVRDDGVGGANPNGHGLTGLADRVEALGGRLRIDSADGDGTVLAVRLPLPTRGRPHESSDHVGGSA